MCYAIPGKISKLRGDTAVVDYEGIMKEANMSLIDNPKVGDFVLVHAGFAIERIDEQSARKTIELIRSKNG